VFIEKIGEYSIHEGKLAPDDARSFYTTRQVNGREAPVGSYWNLGDAKKACRWHTSLAGFLQANSEAGLSDEELALMGSMERGENRTFGGGAGAEFTIERTNDDALVVT